MFLEQIDRTWSLRDPLRGEPWLVNVATDGESYGHHFKFGDMALASAFEELKRNTSAEIVNYGWFLSRFPVVAEVEIIERTAWSCVHGAWPMEQRLRLPSGRRTGLDPEMERHLCAKRSNMFETAWPSISRLRWQTCAQTLGAPRDEYIDLILDRKNRLATVFGKTPQRRVRAHPMSHDSLNFWRCSGFRC